MTGIVKVALRGMHGEGRFALVDSADAAKVLGLRWTASKPKGSLTLYARTSVRGKSVYMHRVVMDAGEGDEIDHVDGDGLNNARANLRFVTHRENVSAAYDRKRQRIAKDTFDAYQHLL